MIAENDKVLYNAKKEVAIYFGQSVCYIDLHVQYLYQVLVIEL